MVVLSTDLPPVHPVHSWSDEEDWIKRARVETADQPAALRRADGRDHASQPMNLCERCGDSLGVFGVEKEGVAREVLRRQSTGERE